MASHDPKEIGQEIGQRILTSAAAVAWLPAQAFDYNIFSQLGSQPSVMVATVVAFVASYGVADELGVLD